VVRATAHRAVLTAGEVGGHRAAAAEAGVELAVDVPAGARQPKGLTATASRRSMMPMDKDDGPEPPPPKDLNLGLLLLLGGLFFLFVLLAGLVGLTP
jgi:hypothetical protein